MRRSIQMSTLLAALLAAPMAMAVTFPPSDPGGTQEVPEPGSLALVVLGLVGAVVVTRLIKRK